MPTIVHRGTKLAFEDRGAGKPAFVFVHGWACDRSFFAPQAEHFSRRHRVVSVDLRGHGGSDKPQGPYPIAAYADDIAYIIEQLGLGKAVAVGHSMGGVTVLQLAAAHPQRPSSWSTLRRSLPHPSGAVPSKRLRQVSRPEITSPAASSSRTCSRLPPIRGW